MKEEDKIKNAPNIITFCRIVLCVPLYIVSPLSPMFAVIYAACGLSDILDGFIARKTGASSKFGAVLDSIADFIVVCVILIKLIPLVELPHGILTWIAGIALIRLTSLAVGYYKYHAFAFLHTYANKATGILLFSFPLAYSVFGTASELIYIICAVAGISAVEELAVNIMSKELDLNIKSVIKVQFKMTAAFFVNGKLTK